MSRRLALIIGNSEYQDPKLARLTAPSEDVNDLAEVLRQPEIGGFDEVTALVNQSAPVVGRAIARLCANKKPEDLLLLYFSGHGVRDDRGRLFLAVQDTELDLLNATAIPAAFVADEMDRSRSKRQVLILDCCHSGAFAEGAKGAPGMSVGTGAAFEGTGYGRVVLTATDSTQYAWEGDQLIGEADNSLFTHYVIQGLRAGEADMDADGRITLDELYNYVYEQVVNQTSKQTPRKFTYNQQGEVVIARNPRPVVRPAELPAELRQALDSPLTSVREAALGDLQRLLQTGQPGVVLAAVTALRKLTEDDSRRVSGTATALLAAYEAQRAAAVAAEAWPAPARPEAEPGAAAPPPAQERAAEPAERGVQAPEAGPPAAEITTVRQRAVQAQAEPDSPAPAPGPVPSAPAWLTPGLPQRRWLPVILTTIGWGLGWVAGQRAYELIIGDNWGVLVFELVGQAAYWITAHMISGAAVSVAWWFMRPATRAPQMMLNVAGWGGASALGWFINTVISHTVDWALGKWVGLAIVGVLAGWVTQRVLLREPKAAPAWEAAGLMVGWALAMDATVLIDGFFDWSMDRFPLGAIAGLIAGLVVVRVMQRQHEPAIA